MEPVKFKHEVAHISAPVLQDHRAVLGELSDGVGESFPPFGSVHSGSICGASRAP
jgi:hypothetical protein